MPYSRKKALNLAIFAYGCLVAMWFCACCWLITSNAIKGNLTVVKSDGKIFITDFMHFYRAGKMVLSEDRKNLYDLKVQQDWLNKLVAPYTPTVEMNNQNVPYYWMLFVPLSFLPIDAAHLVWDAVSMSLAIVGVYLLGRNNNSLGKAGNFFLIGLFLASFAGFQTIYIGQSSLFVLGMVSLYWYSFLKGRDVAAGIFLASVVKLQYLPFFMIPLLVQRKVKTIIAFGATLAVYLLAVGLLTDWQNVFGYPKALFSIETNTYVAADRMISLRSILSHFLPQSIVLPASMVLSVASLPLLGWIWIKAGKNVHAVRSATALTVLIAMLASPHSFEIDCVLLALPAVLTVPAVSLSKFEGLRTIEKAYCLLYFAYPLLSWIIFFAFAASYAAKSVSFALINLILLILCWMISSPTKPPQTQAEEAQS